MARHVQHRVVAQVRRDGRDQTRLAQQVGHHLGDLGVLRWGQVVLRLKSFGNLTAGVNVAAQNLVIGNTVYKQQHFTKIQQKNQYLTTTDVSRAKSLIIFYNVLMEKS